jgi:hypothetical protein
VHLAGGDICGLTAKVARDRHAHLFLRYPDSSMYFPKVRLTG